MSPTYGEWKPVRKIGQGSFGTVYEIEQKDAFGFPTKSALKVIRIPESNMQIEECRNMGESEESIKEYFRDMAQKVMDEVHLMYKLKGNSNIVGYLDHDIRKCEDGIGWEILIRMELLIPLREYSQSKRMTKREVIKLGIDICNALEKCQKFDIIHRDIKPGNILVTEQGDYKLSDFGIAKTVSEDETMATMSKKGTYSYMAPEVYKGEQKYEYSVDLYSLGLVMYQLLNCNRDPFLPDYPKQLYAGDRNKALIKRMSGEMIPYPRLDKGALAKVVLKACSFDPENRYKNPAQMKADLKAILDGEPDLDNFLDGIDTQLFVPSSDNSKNESKSIDAQKEISGKADNQKIVNEINDQKLLSEEKENKNFQEEEKTVLFSYIDENSLERSSNAEDDLQNIADNDSLKEDLNQSGKEEQEDFSKQNEEIVISDDSKREYREENDPKKISGKAVFIAIPVLVLLIAIAGFYFATTVSVPKVTNMTETEAEKVLKDSTLTVLRVDRANSDKVAIGKVIEAENQGKRVKKNSRVVLKLSLGASIVIPDIRGKDAVSVTKELKEKGLLISTKEDYSEKVAKGLVLSQSIDSGQSVNEGTELVISVSLGAKPVKIEDYTDKKIEKVKKDLESKGLIVELKEEYSFKIEKDKIISQSVKKDEMLHKGDKIIFTVSKGVEMVKVPKVIGLDKEGARQALEEVGLKLGSVNSVYSSSAYGRVTYQSQESGSKIEKGSSVSVDVSIGEKPVSIPKRTPSKPAPRKKNNNSSDIGEGDVVN